MGAHTERAGCPCAYQSVRRSTVKCKTARMGWGETGAGEDAESAVAGAKHVLPERGVLAPGSGNPIREQQPRQTPLQSFLRRAAFKAVLVRRVGHDLLGGLIDRPEAVPGSGRHRSMKEIPYGTYFQRWRDDCEEH